MSQPIKEEEEHNRTGLCKSNTSSTPPLCAKLGIKSSSWSQFWPGSGDVGIDILGEACRVITSWKSLQSIVLYSRTRTSIWNTFLYNNHWFLYRPKDNSSELQISPTRESQTGA
ncbi:10549_t:CDS:2 [Funneliformis caledonium]|uniref:10549_t:CDS:1 n=1 Tax=Funneliformis caledonium TaxID=1117310 RepID=A0A9N9E6L2_9GLOM|nr:10549_t:CDS:2 [Funneliformis caledonium]